MVNDIYQPLFAAIIGDIRRKAEPRERGASAANHPAYVCNLVDDEAPSMHEG